MLAGRAKPKPRLRTPKKEDTRSSHRRGLSFCNDRIVSHSVIIYAHESLRLNLKRQTFGVSRCKDAQQEGSEWWISLGLGAILAPLGFRTMRPEWPATYRFQSKKLVLCGSPVPKQRGKRLPERRSLCISFWSSLIVSCLQKLQTAFPLETN